MQENRSLLKEFKSSEAFFTARRQANKSWLVFSPDGEMVVSILPHAVLTSWKYSDIKVTHFYRSTLDCILVA